MTLTPYQSRVIASVEGNGPYEPAEGCAHPKCGKPWTERHHLNRRSDSTPGHWVKVEGLILPNIVGLCHDHHVEVTGDVGGYRARILWRDHEFWWFTLDPAGSFVFAPLAPQPPGIERHLDVDCPACLRPLKSRKEREKEAEESGDEGLAPLPSRPRRVWPIAVPRDHYEDGYEICESLLHHAAEKLGRGEHVSWKYYTIVEVLTDWLMSTPDKVVE